MTPKPDKAKIPFVRVSGICIECNSGNLIEIKEKQYCIDCEKEVSECGEDDI